MSEPTSQPAALSYDRGARPYIPPYFAERGKGPAASVVKIIFTMAILIFPGAVVALVGIGLAVDLWSWRGPPVEAIFGLVFGGSMMLGGVWLIRKPISSLRRWWRSRRRELD